MNLNLSKSEGLPRDPRGQWDCNLMFDEPQPRCLDLIQSCWHLFLQKSGSYRPSGSSNVTSLDALLGQKKHGGFRQLSWVIKCPH